MTTPSPLPGDGAKRDAFLDAIDEVRSRSPLPTDEDAQALYDGAWKALTGRDEPWWGCARREEVERIAEFAAGFRRSVVSTPDVRALIDEARERTTEHARQNPEGSVDLARRLADALEASAVSTPSEGGDCSDAEKAALRQIHGQDARRTYSVAEVKQIVYPLLDRSAVSAPPTITDAARERIAKAIFHADLGDNWSWEQVADPADYFAMADAAVAALGGEESPQ